jgi:CHAD domain-containing protein
MKELPADLLDRPAPEGARWFALARLRGLILERKRLDDPDDTEALHDFRVALRRLRSVVRAYGSVFDDSVSPKIRRRLSRMADAAGVSRDAEVRLQWIKERRDTIEGADRISIAWVEQHLRRERRAGDQDLRRELKRHYAGVTGQLQRGLMRYRVSLDTGERRAVPATRELLSQTLLDMTSMLRERLDAPKRVGAVRALHLARIAAKRLRYALEPLAEGRFVPPRVVRSAGASVVQLASLQDELGRIHDAHIFRRWLRERISEGSPHLTNLNGRLRGVQRLLGEQAAASFEVVNRPASRRRVNRLLHAIEASANALVARPSPGDTFRT